MILLLLNVVLWCTVVRFNIVLWCSVVRFLQQMLNVAIF